MQSELALIALLKSPETIREDVLRTFGDAEDVAVKFAINWSWHHRRIKGMSQANAADHIGIRASHFCNILSGAKHLPPHKINAFEWVTGNHAVTQTIQRFAAIRETEQSRQLAQVIADHITRAA